MATFKAPRTDITYEFSCSLAEAEELAKDATYLLHNCELSSIMTKLLQALRVVALQDASGD